VEERRVRLGSLFRVKDGRQLLIVHLDQPGCFFGDLFAGGHHAGHRLADVAHPVAGKDGPVNQVQADVVRRVGSGDDRLDAGQGQRLADIHTSDQSMGVGAADQPPVIQSGAELQVIGIDRGAGDLFVGVNAGHTLAHRVGGACPFFCDHFSHSLRCRKQDNGEQLSYRVASAMASMMRT